MAHKSLSCAGQVLIEHQEGVKGDDLEREMFILRKLIEGEKADRIGATVADEEVPKLAEEGPDAADFYICTLSNKVIVYKVCPRVFPSRPQATGRKRGGGGGLLPLPLTIVQNSMAAVFQTISW